MTSIGEVTSWSLEVPGFPFGIQTANAQHSRAVVSFPEWLTEADRHSNFYRLVEN